MNLEPAPRLNKWIFLAVDAGLLLTAFLIACFAKNPYAPLPFITTVLLVAAAGIVCLVPFVVQYAAEAADREQQANERVTDQLQRLQAAGESLARAAAQIKAVEEAVHKTAHAAENLPYRMQEKLAEFNEALAGKEEDDREALEQELAELRAANSEQLKAVAEKIQKAVTDWTALEAANRQQLKAAEAALAKVQGAAGDAAAKFEARLAAALATLDGKLAALEPAALPARKPAPEPEPVSREDKPPEAAPVSVVESVAVVDTGSAGPAPTGAEEPKPRKPRAPRKPKADETAPTFEEGTSSGEAAFPDSPNESVVAAAPAEAAASSDGATRLLATAYIGIGNKLFIRGDGPGLSWDKGVPMQFVSIGKWGWATDDATAPIACKLYKNDETAALSGEIFLEPGRHVEVTALF